MQIEHKPDPHWLRRVVEAFDRDSEVFVAEYPLCAPSLAVLQEAWRRPPGDPMIAMYPIMPSQAKVLEPWLSVTLDFNSYDYFLSACTTDSSSMRLDGGFMGQFAPPCARNS